MKTKGSENIRVVVLVLIASALVCGFILIDNSYTEKSLRAEAAGNQLLNSMTYLGQLPWDANEYKLRAILVCGENKLFVENGGKFGTSALGCGYLIANGINIETAKGFLDPEGYVSFKKEVINE